MSRYYGLRCLTCDADTGRGLNHGEIPLRDIASMAGELTSIRSKDTQGYVEISTLGGDFDILPTSFVVDHFGHDIVVYDEGGKEFPIVAPQWWSVLHSIGTPNGMMQVQQSIDNRSLYCLKIDNDDKQQVIFLSEAQAKAIGAIITELGGIG
jgi:hypothetical protein